jgi:phosphoribosylaminoimidazole-succinocarboxamide synthase
MAYPRGDLVEVIYEGKTKQVLRDGERWVLRFKDSVTGDDAGNIDSGGDLAVAKLEGKAEASTKTAAYFFKRLSEAGVKNHFLRLRSDIEMEVRPSERLDLEVIYRRRAYGSFLARYRGRVKPMAELDLVEFNLKDDALGDPLLTPSTVVKLGMATPEEVKQIQEIIRKVAALVQETLAGRGLELLDMKLEFGRIGGELAVVDEMSGDTMRVYDSRKRGTINQLELAERLEVM